MHRADTPINMLYNASDELYEWKIHIQLKESYGWEDDSKEWLATVKVHHKKWKKIKQQAGKAAGSGRGGGGSGKKLQFSWKPIADIAVLVEADRRHRRRGSHPGRRLDAGRSGEALRHGLQVRERHSPQRERVQGL